MPICRGIILSMVGLHKYCSVLLAMQHPVDENTLFFFIKQVKDSIVLHHHFAVSGVALIDFKHPRRGFQHLHAPLEFGSEFLWGAGIKPREVLLDFTHILPREHGILYRIFHASCSTAFQKLSSSSQVPGLAATASTSASFSRT